MVVNAFDGHKERLVDVTLRLRDKRVQRIKQLANALVERRIGWVVPERPWRCHG